jgi:hypothetical protein
MTDIVIRLRASSKLFNPEQHEAASEIETLRKQRDEALRQVAVLREAIGKHTDPSWECNSDHPALRKALSEIPSPGVLCESEPVVWLSTDCIGERYYCFNKPNDKDTVEPLYRKKGEAP